MKRTGPYFIHMPTKTDVRLLKGYLPVSNALTSLAHTGIDFSIKIFRVYGSWLRNTKKGHPPFQEYKCTVMDIAKPNPARFF
jgi:hypothetical protein